MTAPDPRQAVADLRRCMRAGDSAGVARLVGSPATLAGLDELVTAVEAERAAADEARREAVAVLLGEAERARVQASIGPLLEELIGVLAGVLGVSLAPLCVTCRRSLRRLDAKCRRRICPNCGTKSSGWPVTREEAA